MRLAATALALASALLGSADAGTAGGAGSFQKAWQDSADAIIDVEANITLYLNEALTAGGSKTINGAGYCLAVEEFSAGLVQERNLSISKLTIDNQRGGTLFTVGGDVQLADLTLTGVSGRILTASGTVSFQDSLTFDTAVLGSSIPFSSMDGITFAEGFTLNISGSLTEGQRFVLFEGYGGDTLPTLGGTLANGELVQEGRNIVLAYAAGPAPVPEPGCLLLITLPGLALLLHRRRR